MTTTVRYPVHRSTINGNALRNVLSVSVTFDFQGRTSSASITVAVLPDVSQWDIVEISMGASNAGSRIRFRGFLFDLDLSLWPVSATINCKGMLSLAEYHGNSEIEGTPLGGLTDEAQVAYVLGECGITDHDIRGTGSVIGLVAADEAIWEEGEVGLTYIDRLDEISLGYRTFDTIGGTVVRRQVSPRPQDTSTLTFTEGVDMFNANRVLSPNDVKNRVVVEGYSDEFGDVRFAVVQQSPWLPPGINHLTHEFSSPLIERIDENDLPDGISAKDVAIWQILHYNILREQIQFDTPRDDIIAPGMTITVNSPNRLQTNSRYIVQGVDITIDSRNNFTQSVRCVGGDSSLGDIEFEDGNSWEDWEDWDFGGPLTDFRFIVEKEIVLISGNEEEIWVISAENTSFGFVAEVETLEWSLPGAAPETGTGEYFVAVISDSLAGKELTLTATDTNGDSSSLTKVIENSPDTEKTRVIFTAAETVAGAFDGQVWRTAEPEI